MELCTYNAHGPRRRCLWNATVSGPEPVEALVPAALASPVPLPRSESSWVTEDTVLLRSYCRPSTGPASSGCRSREERFG